MFGHFLPIADRRRFCICPCFCVGDGTFFAEAFRLPLSRDARSPRSISRMLQHPPPPEQHQTSLDRPREPPLRGTQVRQLARASASRARRPCHHLTPLGRIAMRALRAGSAAARRLRHRPPHLAPGLRLYRRGLPSLTVSRVLHRSATTPSVSQRSRYAPQRPELRRYSVAALGPPRDVQGSHPAHRGACGLGAFQEQDAGDDRGHGYVSDCCLSRSRPVTRPLSQSDRGSADPCEGPSSRRRRGRTASLPACARSCARVRVRACVHACTRRPCAGTGCP